MKDKFGRNIYYMRISVTDRCNLRCVYCMPEEGVKFIPHDEILKFEEIEEIVEAAKSIGISSIRLTGGEPLVRKGITDLVKIINNINGINKVTLTTNGTLLAKYARGLKLAGIESVNVSLDTLNPEKFREITRRGNITDVIRGIEKSINEGIKTKLNVVLQKANLDEVAELIRFSKKTGAIIRFIEYMPLDSCIVLSENPFVPASKLIETISKDFGEITEIEENIGDGPAKYVKIKSINAEVGIIAAISEPFCSRCNRIRITSNGIIKPCLASNIGYDIKSVIRGEHRTKDIVDIIVKAIESKPLMHHMKEKKQSIHMNKIGG